LQDNSDVLKRLSITECLSIKREKAFMLVKLHVITNMSYIHCRMNRVYCHWR